MSDGTGRTLPASDSAGEWTGIELDLRDATFVGARAPVLRAAAHTGPREYLTVRMRAVSWPLMAALQATGQTYHITTREEDAVEFVVWRRYSAEEHRRYLQERVGAPIYEPPRRELAPGQTPG